MTTTLLNNAPASSFRAVPPEGRRWPCAAATIRVVDQQVITSPDSARAAESSLGWDETAGLCSAGSVSRTSMLLIIAVSCGGIFAATRYYVAHQLRNRRKQLAMRILLSVANEYTLSNKLKIFIGAIGSVVVQSVWCALDGGMLLCPGGLAQ